MYMTKKLPGIPVTPSVSKEWVVVKDDGLAADPDGHLLGDMDELSHEPALHELHVVVAEDEIDVAVELVQNVVPLLLATEAEIAEVEDGSVLRNGLVPATDEFGVHLLDGSERPLAEPDDVLVPKVCVRGEPHILGFKDELVHSSRFGLPVLHRLR